MKLRYRCLILVHDDTVVKSTPNIHYPSFIEALEVLRPDVQLTLEEFVSYCFSPGFTELCKDVLNFNEEEQAYQQKIWKNYTKSKSPDFYEGFPELIREYKSLGGIITVVSHSEREQIERDYKVNCNLIPDLVFGWELLEHQRKPNPYPIIEIMKRYNLSESEVVVVDDLKPGLVMAKSCNIPFIGAGWSKKSDEIINYMKANSDYYFSSVKALKDFIITE